MHKERNRHFPKDPVSSHDYPSLTSVMLFKSNLCLNTVQSRSQVSRLCVFHELCHSQTQFQTEYPYRLNHIPPRRDLHFRVDPYESHANFFSSSPVITSIIDWNSRPPHIAHQTRAVVFRRIVKNIEWISYLWFLAFFLMPLLSSLWNNVLVKCSV